MKRAILKKTDLLILFSCIIVFTILYLLSDYNRQGKVVQVDVEQAGKYVYRSTNISEKQIIVKVNGPYGISKIAVVDSGVKMIQAPCPDKNCLMQGKISNGVIVCVPQKIIIHVEGEKGNNEYDAIVR